jgi:hypothetical protein
MFEVQIFPLAPSVPLPQPAPGRTRAQVPAGYGVQEQCLPFAAAAALGFLIPSPIAFGLCLPDEVPPDGRPFRSPLDLAQPDGTHEERRLFYVKDDPGRGFGGNAHVLHDASGPLRYEPGISFFDRPDQLDLFKLHLPYVWRTPAGIDTLFLPPLNRDVGGLTLLCGVVETDWYANPVNLVLRKPAAQHSVHVSVGDPMAQAAFLARDLRRPTLKIADPSTPAAERFLAQLERWHEDKARHRNAYKRLSHSRNSARPPQ